MTRPLARASHRCVTRLAVGFVLATLQVWVLQGCSTPGSCRDGDDARGVACRTLRAREQLVFGMSKSAAMDTLGSSTVVPPWRTDLGDAPNSLHNPFDSQTVQSVLGEQYEVVRFFVYVERISKCPFLAGRIQLEPLVFFEDRLVGWDWSYVADLIGEPVEAEQMSWGFGIFCDQAAAS